MRSVVLQQRPHQSDSCDRSGNPHKSHSFGGHCNISKTEVCKTWDPSFPLENTKTPAPENPGKLLKKCNLLGSDFGRTDFSRIFIFGPPDFFADFLAGFFLLIFVGKSAQKNPAGKSPRKSSKICTTKILRHTSADWLGQNLAHPGPVLRMTEKLLLQVGHIFLRSTLSVKLHPPPSLDSMLAEAKRHFLLRALVASRRMRDLNNQQQENTV